MPFPFSWVNRRGSAAITSSAVTVNTDNVVFTFPAHSFMSIQYRGSLFVELTQAIPAGTTTTLPIVFSTNGVTQAVTKYNGEALTVADLPGTGVYEFWFDRSTNTLQIMTGIV
ncbi:MAG: hypothetical protein J1E33_06570 [Alistipes sp.]|nr:hypothetical protein [Alistipes sp.]